MKNSIEDRKHIGTAATQPLPIRDTRAKYPRAHRQRLLGWALLPLRLFLGITFIYAGIEKLSDPQYFAPSAVGYIGNQITTFASGSPIHDFLINVAQPHALFVGALVAYGELAIGIAVLLGLLLRPAAFFGMLLNGILFLSATWRVHPYFYGSDIVFVFCWLTLLLAGPVSSVLPTLDALLVPRLLQSIPPIWRVQAAHVLHFILGGGVRESTVSFPADFQPSRRNFLWGIVTGAAGATGILSLAWLSSVLHPIAQTSNDPAIPSGVTAPASGTVPVSNAPGVIAQASHIPSNSATTFTLTSNGDPAVLVHLNDGQFVAYDAVCTHAGCPVSYDAASKLLLCPCHGSAFDPAKAAAVVQGPAQRPLIRVPIHVDNVTGTIMLGS